MFIVVGLFNCKMQPPSHHCGVRMAMKGETTSAPADEISTAICSKNMCASATRIRSTLDTSAKAHK